MNRSRRHFAGLCAKSVIALGSMPLLMACASDAVAFSPESSQLLSVTRDILRHAARAPSGHNSQPWELLLLEPYYWHLHIAATRRLPAVDPRGRETLISIGAFIENLCQAASAYGFSVSLDPLSGDTDDSAAYAIQLLPSAISPTAKDNLIRIQQRRVIRHGQLPRLLSRDDVNWLEAQLPGKLRYVPANHSEAALLREGTLSATVSQCQTPSIMNELAHWTRFGHQTVITHMDGLTTAAMELNSFTAWIVDHFYDEKDVLSASFRKQTVDMTAQLVNEGAGWLIFSAHGSSSKDLIECGRDFQHVFLMLRERQIACHPMSQLLESADGQQTMQRTFGVDVQMLARVGYVDHYPAPVSVRRPVAWFAR